MNRTELAAVWPPSAAACAAAGHERMRPLAAIRAKCLDCTCYQIQEVKLCEALNCPLWPFRAGHHPYKKSPSKGGVPRERSATGTWIASGTLQQEQPSIVGDIPESEASRTEASVVED